MNISATLNVFRLVRDPALCLPHATIPNFNHLPIPLSNAFAKGEKGHSPDIRAVILDKDNCFAKPKQNVIYGPYNVSVQNKLASLLVYLVIQYFSWRFHAWVCQYHTRFSC